jgi:hypothetical protein
VEGVDPLSGFWPLILTHAAPDDAKKEMGELVELEIVSG